MGAFVGIFVDALVGTLVRGVKFRALHALRMSEESIGANFGAANFGESSGASRGSPGSRSCKS